MPGPPRTPTRILKLHGSQLAKTREKVEPKPRKTKPRTAVKMTAVERRVFDGVCTVVKEMGLQATTDGNALARYAKNIVAYNTACAFLDQHGSTYPIYDRHKDGTKSIRNMKRFPESTMRNELEMTLLRLEKQFGLTAAARAALAVEVPQLSTFAEEFFA